MNRADAKAELVGHMKVLRAFALNLARDHNTADDLVQETVLRAWGNMDQFQEGTNMRAWLFTILRNTFYEQRRKAGREVADADGTYTASLADKPTQDGQMELRDFRAAFQRLPAEQREVLMLIGALQHSYEDAAAICGVKVGTIKSRLNRAREAIAVEMRIGQGDTVAAADPVADAVLSQSINSR